MLRLNRESSTQETETDQPLTADGFASSPPPPATPAPLFDSQGMQGQKRLPENKQNGKPTGGPHQHSGKWSNGQASSRDDAVSDSVFRAHLGQIPGDQPQK